MPGFGPSYERAATDDLEESHTSDFVVDPSRLSKNDRRRIWWRNAVISSFFIASWFFFATVLSVYNKWMFDDKRFGFSWPLFVTTLHMFIQFCLAAIARALWPRSFRPENNPSRKDYGQRVIPTAVATCLDIGLSNWSLKTIDLSFYTMCKSSSLVFVLGFAFAFHLEVYSIRLVGVILLIVLGVLLMVATETNFDLPGFVLVMSGSALSGLRWSLAQLLLKNKKTGLDNPAAMVFWLAPIMGITLALLSVLIEDWRDIFSSHFFSDLGQIVRTSGFLILPGTLAFCMVMSEFYILQRVGVVPMSIAGIAKEATTISIAAFFLGEELTPLNIVGVLITIAGISLYTYHKYQKSVEGQMPTIIVTSDERAYSPDALSMELAERERLTNVEPQEEGEFAVIHNGEPNGSSGAKDILFTVDDEETDDDDSLEFSRPESMDAPEIVMKKEIKEERRARLEFSTIARKPMSAQPEWENF